MTIDAFGSPSKTRTLAVYSSPSPATHSWTTNPSRPLTASLSSSLVVTRETPTERGLEARFKDKLDALRAARARARGEDDGMRDDSDNGGADA